MKILFLLAVLALLGTAAPSWADDEGTDSSLAGLKGYTIRVKRWKNPYQRPYGVSLKTEKTDWQTLVNFRRSPPSPPPRLIVPPRMWNGRRYNYLWLYGWFGSPPQILRPSTVGAGRFTILRYWPAEKYGVRIAPEDQSYSSYYATGGPLQFLTTLERERISP
jgi:hypothetical protein